MNHRNRFTPAWPSLFLAAAFVRPSPSPSFAADTSLRTYDFYQPQVKHVVIHEGRLTAEHYGYNHMASVEWFDGRFHAVWGGHAASHKEGVPGQVNLWATSPDFEAWSPPVELARSGAHPVPPDAQGKQWQPNLLNFHDRQLWCVWSFSSHDADLEGLYLSTLDRGGSEWRHRRIRQRHNVGDLSCEIFASQNPVLLPSGRVLAPVTLIGRPGDGGTGTRRWNACYFTDDDGATWACSDLVSSVDDAASQWEPFFYRQRDGHIRAFMRNSVKGEANRGIPPANQQRLTTVGTGADKGTPVRFPDDPVFSFMETANCRPQVFQLAGGRYCLLQQDAFVNHTDYPSRVNVALHFSRSGADDFVAGPPLSRPGVISAYPQGVEHDGVLYAAYTTGPGNFPRSIEGAIVTPAPQGDQYYVWPRSKELVRLEETTNKSGTTKMLRANPDARTALPRLTTVEQRRAIQFAGRASAGVDIDPVDFAAGQSLEFRFEAKVLRLQPAGMLVLCSLGDRIPIRLGMPANRPGRLYACTRNQWEPVCDFAIQRWHTLRVTARGADFTVAVDDQPPRAFPNPLVNPSPRLYLGDGFEVDYIPSNNGSEFLIDLASLGTTVGRGPVPSSVASPPDAAWHTYGVYQPHIERAIVVDAAEQPLRYNHDSSVAWFRDRWICVWNANTIPLEGAPGQLNYESTSRDGLTWSAPRAAFSDSGRCANPVPCPKGTQWQPNLLVVGDRLWCLWSQNSRDAHHGCYLSILDSPDGLWTNRLLTWDGQADPVIDGQPFRLFPTQNPVRLRTGRVLAPVTMMGRSAATNAATVKDAWGAKVKRNSVIYTDDDGATWRVSPGTTLPGLDWRQWEPTVFEQPDGSVLMFARNNQIGAFEGTNASPEQALVWSRSTDGGASWTPHAFVPLQTVVSRMHVMRQPGSDRYLMLHNDWPAGRFCADRRNLALFVNRGGGIDFTAGTGLTDREPEVAYPQMDIHDNAMLFTYSQGPCGLRNIRAVRVSPLPDPDRLHLYPRSNVPPPPRCDIVIGVLELSGGRSLACRTAPAVAPDRVRLEAEVNPDDDGTLFDNRGPRGGFVWGVAGIGYVHLGDPPGNIRSTLPVPRGRWSRVGVAIDYPRGEVVFSVNDTTERLAFKPGRRSLAGASATLFGPNLASSSLTSFEGAIRHLVIDGTNRIFDASRPDALGAFRVPSAASVPDHAPNPAPAGADDALLRLAGDASAGVELAANERAAGDIVELAFEFRIENGAIATLCTAGDANHPARVLLRDGELLLCSGTQTNRCGNTARDAWQRIVLVTGADITRVTLDDLPPAEARHASQATWVYLGEGYPRAPASNDGRIAFRNVRSRILRGARKEFVP